MQGMVATSAVDKYTRKDGSVYENGDSGISTVIKLGTAENARDNQYMHRIKSTVRLFRLLMIILHG